MTVLITGAGLVGTFAAAQLRAEGHDVVLYELHPNREAIDWVLGEAEVPLIEGDVRDGALLAKVMKEYGVEAVIHTAGLLTAGAQRDPLRAVEVNVGGTAQLIHACGEAGVGRLVFCSSVLVYYGMLDRAEAPIPGDFTMRAVSERPPLVYAATKLACEQIGAVYCELAGIEFASLRFGALFGPWRGPVGGVTGLVFRTLIEQLAAGRIEVRDAQLVWQGVEDFTYVRDAADAVVRAALSEAPIGGAHNIAMGRLYSFEDVLAMLGRIRPGIDIVYDVEDKGGIAGFKFERKFPNDLNSSASFGWRSNYPMEAALEDYFTFVQTPTTKTIKVAKREGFHVGIQ